MTTHQGDVFVAWVLIDPCNPPRELMLQFSDGSFEHRAIWGDDAITSWGTLGTTSRYRMGPLPATGKWVRLEVPAAFVGLEGSTLSGMAFTLYDGQAWFDRVGTASRVNVALGKSTSQSSTLNNTYNPISDRAVDGNLSGNFTDGTVTQTNADNQAWWQVDLGAVQPIETVEIWNRTDCCSSRLNNFWLFVSDLPFSSTDVTTTRNQPGVSSYVYPATAGRNTNFLINRTGRYVRIQLAGTDSLSLAEVQVWAPDAASRVNLVGGRSVSASSILPGYTSGPERAVNGNTDPDFYREGSVMHTNNDPQAWFEADLGSVQPISTVDIWNRSDYHPEWLTNFYVFVSDTPFAAKDIATTIAQSGVSSFYWGNVTSIGYTIPVNRTGRYVRVQLTGTPALYLYMTEVQVWSQASSLTPLSRKTPVINTDGTGKTH